MLRKLFLGAAVVAASLMMSDTASADHTRCYRGGYGGGVAVYRAPVVPYGYGRGFYSGYRGFNSPYRSFYGSPYRGGFYGGGFGYGVPYYGYGRGTYIGIGRGGVSLGFGF